MTDADVSTREKLLNAGEQLFAAHGFDGVTVRQIARQAGADPALVSYYFGSKRGLFDEILTRRAEDLNEARLAALHKCEEEAGEAGPTVEQIIDAFTHPLLDRSERGGPGWKSYFALIAIMNNSPEWGKQVLNRYFDPIVRRFMESLRRALPDCREEDLFWSYHFLSGALTLTFAETGRIDELSEGVCRASDLDAVHDRMVPFVAAGFRALCERGQR